jgi:hypothetical protein
MQEFDSGARRLSVAPFYAEIPYRSLRRVALRAKGAPAGEVVRDSGFEYAGGGGAYGPGDWERGLPLEDTFNHAIEHLLHWKDAIEQGEVPTDDDLAAVAWAVLMPLMTFEQEYAIQMRMRSNMLTEGLSPAQADERMRGQGVYLLLPLSPAQAQTVTHSVVLRDPCAVRRRGNIPDAEWLSHRWADVTEMQDNTCSDADRRYVRIDWTRPESPKFDTDVNSPRSGLPAPDHE